jgi:outer membrane protein assembly factor BamB
MRQNNNKRRSSHRIPLPAVIAIIVVGTVAGGSLGILGGEYLSGVFSANAVMASADASKSNGQEDGEAPSEGTPGGVAEGVRIPASNLPSAFKGFSYEVLVNRIKTPEYKRPYKIEFPSPEKFSKLEGITCFRGNNYRDSASYGSADVKLGKLKKVWSAKNGYIDLWTGTGWNGQPSIVKWSPEVKEIMNIYPAKKKKQDLKEVIYATLDGKIYFFDLEDGKPTRPAIDVGSPHKGSVVVDPRGYPLLYAGQGIPEKGGKSIPIGYRIFSLIDQKQLYFLNGMDPDTYRYWGAFDSGPMIDAATDTFIECGENGIIYSGKLNTSFDLKKRSISIRPELVKYRYKSPFGTKIGVENSPAVYKNYIYFADNSGLFQCIDLNTMKPVWIRDVTDDTDSTPALEETENGVFLYTACEVDRQGENGASYIRKLDAMTGELLWEKKIPCYYDSVNNGGAFASPVIGKNDIKDLVVYNIAKTGNTSGSTLLAINRQTGETAWSVNMKYYCWSSPVAVYTKEGKSYIVNCDSRGNMMLYEGISGKLLDTISLSGANVEASPAAYDDMLVVGTRGRTIWGIRIE